MEDLPDDVIISNIDTFRNIIKQQKSYVDEMQLHLSNKDNVIHGLQQTIKLLESTIESNQDLIEKLRTDEKESSINNVQRVYDITNDLHILEQLEEKEQIISEMLITYIPREQHVKEIKERERIIGEMLNNQHDLELATLNNQNALELTSIKEQNTLELASINNQHTLEIASIKEQNTLELAIIKEQNTLELAKINDQHTLELETIKDQYASKIATIKEQYKEKLFPNNISIKDKIKIKYIKKELEIYKNENISLKNQIEFFKNMVMMNSMYNFHRPPYDHNLQCPTYDNNFNRPRQDHNLQCPIYDNNFNRPPPDHNLQSYQSGESYRTSVKTTEQIKSSNNVNQHKNKMGCVLEQLQQLQKQKNS
jgi:hypothetical protein